MDMNELLNELQQMQKKPPLFERGEPKFWDDPHISKHMLEAHLSVDTDLASRKLETIDKTVDHLFSSGVLRPGMRVLDLGCGPGLYAERLSKGGCIVTGLDLSERSLAYARERAKEQVLSIDYRCMNFLDMNFSDEFNAALQIYGEVNTFSDEARHKLFGLVHKALKKNGKFIFDVTTRVHRMKYGCRDGWYVSDGGFFSPGRHLVLERGFDYPEQSVWLDQYIVADQQGVKVYRNWFRDFTLDEITEELKKADFTVKNVWNELTGVPYREGGEWIAIAAQAEK